MLAAALMLVSAPAVASANVDCQIDDKVLKFDMEAIAGRGGPIVQVNVGTIAFKSTASVTPREITFDRTHIVQQWLQGDDLRLSIEIDDEKMREAVALVVQARLDKKSEKYGGGYVLKISRDGKTREFKGRIKECIAG